MHTLADADRLKPVERALANIPGHGSGARLSYLWMRSAPTTASSRTA
ncbi:hypothetical protein [Streptomyces virginiae]